MLAMRKSGETLNILRNSIGFLLVLCLCILISKNAWAKGKVAGLEVVRNGSVYEVKVDPDGFSLPLVIEVNWGDGQSKTTTWSGGNSGGNPRLERWYVHEHKYQITRQTRVTITVKIYGIGEEGTATRSITAIITP